MGRMKQPTINSSRFKVRDKAPEKAFDPKVSRSNKLSTREDAFGGDEDEFHSNRDQVLFEMDGQEARGGMDELDSDDEIFDLNLPQSDEEIIEDEEEEEFDEEDEDEEDSIAPHREASPPRGRFAKSDDLTQDILSDASNDSEHSSDEEETWAPNTYHASRKAPGEPDSEDDEALDMEAEEAKRLQKKFKTTLAGDDYGFGDGAEEEGEIELVREKSRLGGRLEEAMMEQKELGANYTNEEEAIAFLLKKQPETLALLDDFAETAERMTNVEKALVIVRMGENGKEHPALAIMELEHQALSTYLPTLAFYFSLLLTATPPPHLVTKVLARITSLRSALATMEELDLTAGNIDDSDSEGSDEDDERLFAANTGMDEEMEEYSGDEYGSEEEEEITDSMLGGLEDEELEELMKDMADDADADALIARVKSIQRMKLGLPPLEEEMMESEEEEMEIQVLTKPKSKNSAKAAKRIAAREAAIAANGGNVLNLSGPILPPIRKVIASTSRVNEAEDDYLDPTSLSLTDLSDKAQRKHSLRFHVSQVHQKSVKRESSGTQFGGDDDLPRKSKEALRREVLKKQQHGGQKTGDELDGMDWDESDKKGAADLEGEDYYDLVKRENREKKVAKKVEYDDAVSAQKALNDEVNEGGPRGANRKIMANKGLQPKRAKINRNPRVKKRMAYDKAVKKVATMKSVYKGGQASLGAGGYEGEKSGIGGKVVKSIRLGGK